MSDAPEGRTPAEEMALQKLRSRLLSARPEVVSVSRYELVERVGRGASATVWRAFDPKLGRDVALKLVERWDNWAGSEREARARVLREAQAVAALNHPNIVPIFDVGKFDTPDGRTGVFLAMEFAGGKSLRTWLQEDEPSLAEILDAFDQAARGLAAAHAADVVHRDFKPSNAVIDANGRVRVIDFGLARPLHAPSSGTSSSAPPIVGSQTDSLTATGTVMGTPAYMSPEQHVGDDVTPASDQFSLCVSLFEALASERPFQGEDLAALALAKQRRTIPEDALARIPAELRAVLLRGLSPDPAQRWPSIEALRRALRPPRPAKRWAWVAMAVGTAVVAALAVGWYTAQSPARHPASAQALPDPLDTTGIEQARLLRQTGDRVAARQTLESIASDIEASNATHAAAVVELARLAESEGAVTEALERSNAAFFEASQAAAHGVAFDLAALQAELLFERDPQSARKWLGQAEAMFERAHVGPEREAQLLSLRARVSENAFALKRAKIQLDDAHALLVEIDAPELELSVLANQARVAVRLGDFDGYIGAQEQSAVLAQLEFGPAHLQTGRALSSLAETYAYAGRSDDAMATIDAAFETVARAVGPMHPAMGSVWQSRGIVYAEAGIHGPALDAFDQAEAIYRTLSSPRDRDLALSSLWAALGLTLEAIGQPEEALQTVVRARDLHASVLGAGHVFNALHGNNIAMLLRGLGRLEDAEREALAVVEIYETQTNVDPTVRSFTYLLLTKLMLDAERPAEARRWADATIEVWDEVAEPTEDAAVARFYAAKAAIADDPEAARAYALDAIARAADPEGAKVVRAWMAEQGISQDE